MTFLSSSDASVGSSGDADIMGYMPFGYNRSGEVTISQHGMKVNGIPMNNDFAARNDETENSDLPLFFLEPGR